MGGKDVRAVNIVCVLRSGGDYDTEDVERLHDSVRRHCGDFPRFWCLGDVNPNVPGIDFVPLVMPWPGWWAKLELFRPSFLAHLRGSTVYLDLDTIVTGDISEWHVPSFTMLSDFYRPANPQSGVMAWPEGDPALAALWQGWIKNPAGHMETFRGDGEWIGAMTPHAPRMQDTFPGEIASYKVHVRPRGVTPSTARAICFHGRPRPRALQWRLPPG